MIPTRSSFARTAGPLVLLAAALIPVVAAAPVVAQAPAPPVVERVGSADVAIDQRLDRLLEADPLIVIRDTVFAPGDTIRRSVLVLDATLIHEGVITGDLVLVDAGAFVRPESVVRGDLVNVAGGLYRSQIARVGGEILDLPLAPYRVVREGDRILIDATGGASPLELDEFSGLHAPTYDRVNGVTAVVGAGYRLPRVGGITPRLHGQAGWMTERGEPTYAVDASLGWFATTVYGGYGKGWVTNDDWIRGDLMNSLNYLWDGDDYRDYHSSERYWVGVARRFGDEEKRFFGTLSLTGQVEDGESLTAGNPWHLWGDSTRANPPIDEGRITSLLAGFDMQWEGLETLFEGGVEYERADDWQGGDFAFDRVTLEGDFAMHALWDHTLEIEVFGQLPLRGDPLPLQRWSYVGGSGTLQTLEFGEFYGDHVAFIESTYSIPFSQRLALPIVGAPVLELIHAAGMAWTDGDDRPLRQEIGARLRLFAFYARYMLAPDGEREADLDFGVSWPFGDGYPWEGR